MSTLSPEGWLFSDSQIERHIGHSLLHNAVPCQEEDILSRLELALAARQDREEAPANPRLPVNETIDELRQLLRNGGAFSTVLLGEPVTIIRHSSIGETDIQPLETGIITAQNDQ